MTPKKQAVKDIKKELKEEHKAFIDFRKELNYPIRQIVREYLREQKHC